jgi:hypothetical protein
MVFIFIAKILKLIFIICVCYKDINNMFAKLKNSIL